MSTTTRITGAIDRCVPDPGAPSDQLRAWIGMVTASWDLVTKQAAIIRVATGRGTGDRLWGPYVLVLRWIGDEPPTEVAQAVYDLVQNGGPALRPIASIIVAQPRTEAQPSYRVAQAS